MKIFEIYHWKEKSNTMFREYLETFLKAEFKRGSVPINDIYNKDHYAFERKVGRNTRQTQGFEFIINTCLQKIYVRQKTHKNLLFIFFKEQFTISENAKDGTIKTIRINTRKELNTFMDKAQKYKRVTEVFETSGGRSLVIAYNTARKVKPEPSPTRSVVLDLFVLSYKRMRMYDTIVKLSAICGYEPARNLLFWVIITPVYPALI